MSLQMIQFYSVGREWAECQRTALGTRHSSHPTMFVPNGPPPLQALANFRVTYNHDCVHLEETQKEEAEEPKVDK